MRHPAIYPTVAVVAWGLMFSIFGQALHHVDAFNLTAIRYGLAAAIFVALLVAREGVAALWPAGRVRETFVLGFVGFAGFNLLLGLALGRTHPQNAALMVALTPLLTLIVRWVRDGARPAAPTIALVAVALFGVALVVTKGHPALGSFGAGDLLMFGAVASWATYTHGAGRYGGWSPLRYATLTALFGTVTILVLTAIADAAGLQHLPTAHDLALVWPNLAYVVLVGAVVAVLAWNVGVRRLGAPNAALFMNLVPVVALAIAVTQGYRPGDVELLGIAITVTAIVATNLLGRRPAAVPAESPNELATARG